MTMDSAAGVIRAALRPWAARAAMSSLGVAGESADDGGDGEHGQAGQEHPPARQQVGDAATEEQAAAGHHQVGGDDPLELSAVQVQGSRPMVGRAVLTTEMSRTTRICAVRATARTAHDFRGPSSASGGRGACGAGGRGAWTPWPGRSGGATVWHLGGHRGLLPGVGWVVLPPWNRRGSSPRSNGRVARCVPCSRPGGSAEVELGELGPRADADLGEHVAQVERDGAR